MQRKGRNYWTDRMCSVNLCICKSSFLSDRGFIRRWIRCRWCGGKGSLFHFYRTLVASGLQRKRRIFTNHSCRVGEEEYDVVGKILYHFFVNLGLFPVQFCEVSLQNAFIGQYSENALIGSFLRFISRSDSLVVYDVLMQNKFDY